MPTMAAKLSCQLQPSERSQHALRLRVVAGVGRDARLLHVREAERRERLPVRRQHPQPRPGGSRSSGRASRRSPAPAACPRRGAGRRPTPARRRRRRAEQRRRLRPRTARPASAARRRSEPLRFIGVAPRRSVSRVRSGPTGRTPSRCAFDQLCGDVSDPGVTGRPRTGRRSGTERRSRSHRHRSMSASAWWSGKQHPRPPAARRR